jgi:hypothetical protein
MKSLKVSDRNLSLSSAPRWIEACLAPCQKLVAQFQKTKEALLAEFQETREAHRQLLRLALLEAEALAFQTPYPELVFPTLAREKAEAVAAWSARQRSIQQRDWAFAFAE